MKTLLSSAAIALAIAATTICAKAECVSGVSGSNIIVCSPHLDDIIDQPQQRNEKAHHPAPIHRVGKRPKPQLGDEKAPPARPPPALPSQ